MAGAGAGGGAAASTSERLKGCHTSTSSPVQIRAVRPLTAELLYVLVNGKVIVRAGIVGGVERAHIWRFCRFVDIAGHK